MARRRRRSGGRTKTQGRQGLWVRHATFTPSTVTTAPLYTEDAVIFPDLWEREQSNITQPKRGTGGPLLKRAFGSVAWEIRQSDVGDTIKMPVFEILIFQASTTEPPATGANDFVTNLENQRVLHYSMAGSQHSIIVINDATDITRWYATMKFDIKVQCRLANQDIVMSTRCSETETAEVNINVRALFSAYITTP